MLNIKTYILGSASALILATSSQASLAEQDPLAPASVPAPAASEQPTIREASKDLGKAIKAEVKPAAQAAKDTYNEDVKPVVQDVKQETSVVYKKSEKEVKRGLRKLGLKKNKKK